MKMTFTCHVCGKNTELEVDEKKYMQYRRDSKAQEAFADKDSFYRETIISGMCYACQEKLFNRPAPGNEAEWGKFLGECCCCGRPVYEKDVDKSGAGFKCASCGNDEYEEV